MQTENFRQPLFSWRELIYKELMKAEIIHEYNTNLSTEENILSPNMLMNERHKMGQSQSRLQHMKLPKKSKYIDANNLLEKGNSKILMYEKEKEILTKAVENLEQSFCNNTLSVKLSCHKMEKRKELRNFNLQNINSHATANIINSQQYFLNLPNVYNISPLQQSKVNYKISKTKLGFSSLKKSEEIVNKNFEGFYQAFSCYPGTEKSRPKAFQLLENKGINGCGYYYTSECFDSIDRTQALPTPQEISSPNDYLEITQTAAEKNPRLNMNLLTAKLGNRFQLFLFWKRWRKLTVTNRNERQKQFRIKKIELFLAKLKHGGKISETKSFNMHKKNLSKIPNIRNIKKEVFSRKLVSQTGTDLEKIEMDLNQSAIETHKHLQKSLKNFHPNSQLKVKALSALHINNKFNKTEVKRGYSVPSFLVSMENRCKERKERWENIYNKKRQIEEEKEKIEKEREVEKMRAEEIKQIKKLNEIKKKNLQRKKAEEEKERKRKLMQYQMNIAQKHYKELLMKRCGLIPWKRLIKMKNIQLQKAAEYYETHITKLSLKHWKEHTHLQISLKYEKADNFFCLILLKHAFKSMLIEYNESVKKLQVASDWSDTKFTEKIFQFWLKYVRKEHLDNMRKAEIAITTFYRKIVLKCFKKWKEFPVLIKNEREKEMRKRLWRHKIQEFLPDYEPPCIFDT